MRDRSFLARARTRRLASAGRLRLAGNDFLLTTGCDDRGFEGDLSRQIFEYILPVYRLDLEELKTMLRNAGYNELEAIVDTIAETLLEQGEERGLIKGLTKGRAETLLRLARQRFGDVPAARADEVHAADAATLDRWLDALLGADTLDAVFDPTRHH